MLLCTKHRLTLSDNMSPPSLKRVYWQIPQGKWEIYHYLTWQQWHALRGKTEWYSFILKSCPQWQSRGLQTCQNKTSDSSGFCQFFFLQKKGARQWSCHVWSPAYRWLPSTIESVRSHFKSRSLEIGIYLSTGIATVSLCSKSHSSVLGASYFECMNVEEGSRWHVCK